MRKHLAHFQKRWRLIVISLLAIGLIMTINASAAGITIRRFVFPKYPAMANRSRCEAIFVIEMDITSGRVDAIRIISSEGYGPGHSKMNIAPPDFIRSINDSISKWEFDQNDINERMTIRLNIEFLLAKASDGSTTGDEQSTTFKIQEKNNLPLSITIEAIRIGPN